MASRAPGSWSTTRTWWPPAAAAPPSRFARTLQRAPPPASDLVVLDLKRRALLWVGGRRRRCRFRPGGLLGARHLGQLAGLEHLLDDVAAAHQLAVDVELREGAPIGELAGDLAERIEQRQDVDGAVLDAELLEYPNDSHREPAPGHLRCALHEQQHLVLPQELLDLLLQLWVGRHAPTLASRAAGLSHRGRGRRSLWTGRGSNRRPSAAGPRR